MSTEDDRVEFHYEDLRQYSDETLTRLAVAGAAHNARCAADRLARIGGLENLDVAVEDRLFAAAELAEWTKKAADLALVEARMKGRTWGWIAEALEDNEKTVARHGKALHEAWRYTLLFHPDKVFAGRAVDMAMSIHDQSYPDNAPATQRLGEHTVDARVEEISWRAQALLEARRTLPDGVDEQRLAAAEADYEARKADLTTATHASTAANEEDHTMLAEDIDIIEVADDNTDYEPGNIGKFAVQVNGQSKSLHHTLDSARQAAAEEISLDSVKLRVATNYFSGRRWVITEA